MLLVLTDNQLNINIFLLAISQKINISTNAYLSCGLKNRNILERINMLDDILTN